MKNFHCLGCQVFLLNNPAFAVFLFCRLSQQNTSSIPYPYIPSFGGGVCSSCKYIWGRGGENPSKLVIRKFVQDDTSHSGTPLNPQGSREHQLLGSHDSQVSLSWNDWDFFPSKIQGILNRSADVLVPKCVARNFRISSWDIFSPQEQAEELLMVPGGCAEGKEEPHFLGWHFLQRCSNHKLCI